MDKRELHGELSKRAMETEAFQKNLQIHMQVFRPILEPAFACDAEARVKLVAALNRISNRDADGALDYLEELADRCKTDADRAAFLFFTGVAHETDGENDEAMDYYRRANEYGHDFYRPYFKIAKFAYSKNAYDIAETNFREALRCLAKNRDGDTLEARVLAGGMDAVIASIHNNLVSCLVKMHRYEDALKELEFLKALPYIPGSRITEAILYAAMGDTEALDGVLAFIEQNEGGLYASTKAATEQILEGRHPHFSDLGCDETKIYAFWAWFSTESERLKMLLAADETEAFLEEVKPKLATLVPMQGFQPTVKVTLNADGGIIIELSDLYMRALNYIYKKFTNAMPSGLAGEWNFKVIR